jgi:hypothetical protein
MVMFLRGGRARAAVAACAVGAALFACGDDAPSQPETQVPAAEVPALPSEPPSAPPAAPAEKPGPAATPAPAPSPAPPASEAQLSLEELGARIKATPAIGTFSKLALKNDIDDLVDELRGYHEHGKGNLDDLHQRYEALVLKLLALLEDDEPELALALGRSRERIWNRLLDPVEFAKLST